MSFLPFGFIYVWELRYTKPENPRTQKEVYVRTLRSAKQMLRLCGQEPEANVGTEGAVVFRPEPVSVYRREGLRLGDLTNSEKQEITKRIESLLDSIEGSGQAGKAIGLNSAARAIVRRIAAGRGFSHETSEDKSEMLLFHGEKAPLRGHGPASTHALVAASTPRRLSLSLPPRSDRSAPAPTGASPTSTAEVVSPATAVSGGTLFELELLRKENAQLRKELERSETRTAGLQTQLRAQHSLRQASHNKVPTTGYDASIASATLLPDSEWVDKAVVDISPSAGEGGPVAILATAYTYDCDQITPALCAACRSGTKVLLLVDEKTEFEGVRRRGPRHIGEAVVAHLPPTDRLVWSVTCKNALSGPWLDHVCVCRVAQLYPRQQV